MQHAKTMSAVAALAIFAACGWAHSLAAGDAAPSAVQPLLSGGNPDPTVCRVGDEYYIVTSSFSLSPGLPVYRSTDMVNWEVISHAWRESWPCKTPDDGIWAPTLRHHDGVFYLTVTWHDGFKKAENYLLTARDPAGPWSKPMKIDAKTGIDGSLFFDGEDAWYLSNQQPSKQKWRGHCQIWMQRIDLETGRLFGDKHVLTDGFGEGAAFAEGPHLYKIGGKYLLLHAQGGTAWGHMEIALVSDCVTGPYVHVAGNPVLTAKDWGRSSPLQAFGHADLVQMPDGEWRAVFLGMRMADEGKKCPLGRETFSCRVDLDSDGMPTRFRRSELVAGDWNDPAATRYSLLDRPGDPVRYVKVRNLAARVDYPDKPFRFCAALAAVAPLKGASAADPVQTCESGEAPRVIRNDAWWNTVDGKPIYSNGGGCYFYEGRWYWYGCRYEEAERVRFDSAFRVDAGGLHTTFVGVTCYSSDDLVNWRDEGIVYAGEGAESEAHGRWFGRVGVAAVPSEGKFVLAMQYMGGVLLAVADSPRGPFVFQEGVDMSASTGYRTTGDQSVFYDDIHGKGYLVFSKPHGRDKTYVADLGYRNGRAFVGAPRLVFAGHGREGNCMFMHRGKYYLCASDLYGWDGSRAYWMVADSPMGPYRKSSDGDMFLMRNAVEDYCHVSQTGFFVTVRGAEQETVVFCGDRWTQFADNGIGFNVWTPLSFDGDEPVFNSLSEWSLDAATGRWAVGSGNNYVRNGSFDADRRQIPIHHKPDQDFVSGWTVEPAGGFLNATNKTCDKAFVTGKFALNLPAPFPRRAFQKIEDIPNGNYMLRYWRDDGKGWQRHEESVCVTNGTHVVEFVATAPCRIDDVSLIAAQAGAGLPNEIVAGWGNVAFENIGGCIRISHNAALADKFNKYEWPRDVKTFAAGGKLRGGFTHVPAKCRLGFEPPFRPFFRSYDDGGAKVSANQVASPCEAALRAGFANPPPDVKIGCYYYWVNERVDEEGVKKDLKWMKENGITRAFLATEILPDGTRIRFTEQSLFEVVFPGGRTETWNPVSGKIGI